MASFKLQWRASTKKVLRKLPRQEVARVIAAAEALACNPFPPGHEKLTGAEDTFRIRVGDYRVVDELNVPAQVVEIQRVRHRKDVYRK
jgi:mRNA interferase RelE/StbE